MRKFEYLVLTDDEVDLKQLGADQWELVTVLYRSWENERKGCRTGSTTFYFKRERTSYYPPLPSP